MQVLGLDDPIAAESGWPQISFSFSGGFWPSSLPLFHGVTLPLVFVAVSMSRSSVEVKELHVDPDRRALVDPFATVRLIESGHPDCVKRTPGDRGGQGGIWTTYQKSRRGRHGAVLINCAEVEAARSWPRSAPKCCYHSPCRRVTASFCNYGV